jgi:UDP-N-acetylglucosamine 2-epimerase (non-hydrolysing)
MTILGTRPEIIRLAATIPVLDRFCEHVLVHTGQNYDDSLSEIFFREMALRKPDVQLGVKAIGFGDQVGEIIRRSAEVLAEVKPDRVLILGDTNSGMSAFSAARQGIPVYHIESGNRCFDDRVPEEVNRRVIDTCSTVLMAYTNRSKDNLLQEGVARERIFVIGNPIFEVMNTYQEQIEGSEVLTRLGLKPNEYFAVTLHRTENVDDLSRLNTLLETLAAVGKKYGQPVIVSWHPRTADRMKAAGIDSSRFGLRFVTPLGFFDFVKLEKNARCVITDSGTLQDECSILHVPLVTCREVTERAETQEYGSNLMGGVNRETILRCVDIALKSSREWTVPPEYLEPKVSLTIAKILLGHLPFRRIKA